jgi:hypothetical protein
MQAKTHLLLACTILALSACHKHSATPAGWTLPGNTKVYTAVTSNNTAFYYINDKAYQVTNGTFATANAIAVAGNDVYLAGKESKFNNTNDTTSIAKYWKNGTATSLTDGTNYAVATGIALLGNDVYVCGYEIAGGHYVAILWKNGSPTVLTAPNHTGIAFALCTSGNDIYIAGYDETKFNYHACYWKNGTQFLLPDTLINTLNACIAVKGSDVHVGDWKNGVLQPLQLTYTTFAVNGIYIDTANNIWLAGYDYPGTNASHAVYWKNGSETFLNNGTDAEGIAADSNGHIFIAGIANDGATFWRDGVPYILDRTPESSARAIVVVN